LPTTLEAFIFPGRNGGFIDSSNYRKRCRMFPPDFVEAMFRFSADGEFDDSIVVPPVQDTTDPISGPRNERLSDK
jgi:hypothetical protein